MHALTLLLIATLVFQSSAQAPYYGRWRSNPAKSDVGTFELTYTDLGGGELQQTTDDGRSFRFRIDGKEYDDGAGRTVNWKQLSPTSWEATTYVKGKAVFTGRFDLSSTGKEMKWTTKYAQAGIDQITTTMHRAGGGSGMVGKWISKGEMPVYEMLVEPEGANGIRMSSPEIYEVRAQFDGKPYPVTGSMIPAGSTASFERIGSRSLRTREVTGKAVFEGTYTVSDDGQTLTETGYEGKIKRTWVFDRVGKK